MAVLHCSHFMMAAVMYCYHSLLQPPSMLELIDIPHQQCMHTFILGLVKSTKDDNEEDYSNQKWNYSSLFNIYISD